jgi:uncharacterized membrane protein (DUF4010 family)
VLLAIVVVAVRPEALRFLGASLALGFGAAVAGASFSLRDRSGARVTEAVAPGRAFNLIHAVGFAVLLSALTAMIGYLTGRFGALTLPVGAALAGFFDVHAAAASALSVASAATLPRDALISVLLAFSTNTISKLVAAIGTGGLSYSVRVAAGLIFTALATWAPLLWRIA